ncbi:MAG: AAA family ATPase [candidate division KSB1 bacterium]|nr:AAA family ATPase [candidate division KSB1 bacterium]
MVLKYFNLKQEPFANTPDPRFLFRSATHHEALERLTAAVSLRRGICAVVAEPGLGKSTIIRTLLEGLNSQVNFAWVFNTTLNPTELLRFICRDFGLIPTGKDKADLLIELYTFLVREYNNGRISLLIVDEAQNLSPEALEEIRLLSNLETKSHKLLQIILSGQPQLDVYLKQPEMIQLRQRIACQVNLARLTPEESAAYICHRLAAAGAKDVSWFTRGAMQRIGRLSEGIPRLINQMCDAAMTVAASEQRPRIEEALIDELLQRGVIMAPRSKAPWPTTPQGAVIPKAAEPPVRTAAPRDEAPKAKPRKSIIWEKKDLFDAVDLTELLSVI